MMINPATGRNVKRPKTRSIFLKGKPYLASGQWYTVFELNKKEVAKRIHRPLYYSTAQRANQKESIEHNAFLQRLQLLMNARDGAFHRKFIKIYKEAHKKDPKGIRAKIPKFTVTPFESAETTGIMTKMTSKANVAERKLIDDLVKKELHEAIYRFNKVNEYYYEKTEEALPGRVPAMTGVLIDPNAGPVISYAKAGDTLKDYWRVQSKKGMDEAKKRALLKDAETVADLLIQAYKKGIIVDAHWGNWARDKNGFIRLIDVEPASIHTRVDIAHMMSEQKYMAELQSREKYREYKLKKIEREPQSLASNVREMMMDMKAVVNDEKMLDTLGKHVLEQAMSELKDDPLSAVIKREIEFRINEVKRREPVNDEAQQKARRFIMGKRMRGEAL